MKGRGGASLGATSTLRRARKGSGEPALTTKRGRANTYAHEVQVLGAQGRVVLRVLQEGGGCFLETAAGLRLLDLESGREVAHLPPGPRTRIRVLGEAIAGNRRVRQRDPRASLQPVLELDRGQGAVLAYRLEVRDPEGDVPLAWVVYRPDKPLSCGARVWVETGAALRFLDDRGAQVPCLPIRRTR